MTFDLKRLGMDEHPRRTMGKIAMRLLLLLITLCVTVSFYYWSYGDLRIWAWNGSEDSTSLPNLAGTGTMIDRARAAVPRPGKETAEALNLERIQPADLDK